MLFSPFCSFLPFFYAFTVFLPPSSSPASWATTFYQLEILFYLAIYPFWAHPPPTPGFPSAPCITFIYSSSPLLLCVQTHRLPDSLNLSSALNHLSRLDRKLQIG